MAEVTGTKQLPGSTIQETPPESSFNDRLAEIEAVFLKAAPSYDIGGRMTFEAEPLPGFPDLVRIHCEWKCLGYRFSHRVISPIDDATDRNLVVALLTCAKRSIVLTRLT